MNKTAIRSDALLLLTALIWGFAFVAQRSGMEFVGPFTYNGIRFALGSLSLLPLILILDGAKKRRGTEKVATLARSDRILFVLGTLAAGSVLFLGASLQQMGIVYTTAGKAGFITGLYVVLVPLTGIFLGHKTGLPTWLGAAAAVVGLYFLSGAGQLGKVNPGDILVALSALFWTAHVLVIDHLAKRMDALKLAASQFAWVSVFSLVVAILTEQIQLSTIMQALAPILYGGLGSVGIAYTLQVVAQKDAPAAHSAIILCLEGVFAMLGGVLLLSEPFGLRSLLGSFLMLAGMIATQWDVIVGRKRG
jgi:drug/metabolite transporter (DMT)-like permease